MENISKYALEPYLLGCLLGDGGLHGNLSFATKDDDILENVNTSLALYNYTLSKQSTNPNRSSEYSIKPIANNNIKYHYIYKNNEYTSKELLIFLQKEGYNITSLDTLRSIAGTSKRTTKSTILKHYPNMAPIQEVTIKDSQDSYFLHLLNHYNLRVRFDQKRIPEEYLTAPFNIRLAIFQGLMDTDGCGSGHRLEFCVSNKLLANDFLKLATSLGYTGKISIRQPKYFNKKYNEYRYGKTAYRVHLNNIEIIPFRCQRKINMYLY